MRYDKGIPAAGFSSYECFGFETLADFSAAWNDSFEAIRSGFEMACGKAKSACVYLLSPEVPAMREIETSILIANPVGTAVLRYAS